MMYITETCKIVKSTELIQLLGSQVLFLTARSYLSFHLDIFHLFCILSLELGFSHPALDFRVYVTSTALFGSLPHI